MQPLGTFRTMPADNTRVVIRLPLKQEPAKPAGDLSHKIGKDDYYLARKKDFEKRHPGKQAPDYYQNYGNKYLRRFKYGLRPQLSPAGQRWVDRTLVALQRKIEEKRAKDPVAFDRLEQNPEAFKEFCFDSHPDAYLEGGLKHLSLKEQAMIANTPDAGDLLSVDGVEQAVKTGVSLMGDYLQHPQHFVIPNLMEVQRGLSGPAAIKALKSASTGPIYSFRR